MRNPLYVRMKPLLLTPRRKQLMEVVQQAPLLRQMVKPVVTPTGDRGSNRSNHSIIVLPRTGITGSGTLDSIAKTSEGNIGSGKTNLKATSSRVRSSIGEATSSRVRSSIGEATSSELIRKGSTTAINEVRARTRLNVSTNSSSSSTSSSQLTMAVRRGMIPDSKLILSS